MAVYCNNRYCPHNDCERRAKEEELPFDDDPHFTNLQFTCRKYVEFIVSLAHQGKTLEDCEITYNLHQTNSEWC